MDKIVKLLKIILLIIAILIGGVLLGGLVFVFNGIRSGDLESYVAKTAVDTLLQDTSLTPVQESLLNSGDFEGLAKDLEENVTPEQVDCAVEVLGPVRAEELLITKDPSPQEILKLSKCL